MKVDLSDLAALTDGALDEYGRIRIVVEAGEYSKAQIAALAVSGVAIIEVAGTREPKVLERLLGRLERKFPGLTETGPSAPARPKLYNDTLAAIDGE